MRRAIPLIPILALTLLVHAPSSAGEEPPRELFRKANALYEEGRFKEAAAAYDDILAKGFRSEAIYYNLANSYFKLGNISQAILNYERAKLLDPNDPDIKVNLDHANSLAEDYGIKLSEKWWTAKLKALTSYVSLEELALTLSVAYLLVVMLLSFMVFFPRWGAKVRLLLVTLIALLVAASASFAVRFYEAEWFKGAIVIAKEAECKFEPFDKSTIYFKVHEGAKVFVIKEKEPWVRVRRLDGKSGWMKGQDIEFI